MDFSNTKVAFYHQNNRQLRMSYWLFSMLDQTWLVALGKWSVMLGQKLGLPLHWLLKPNVFNHFCGGETVEKCRKVIDRLHNAGISAILDYSVEAQSGKVDFEKNTGIIIKTVDNAGSDRRIPFAVFKFTALGSIEDMMPFDPQQLTPAQQAIFDRVNRICKTAWEQRVSVLLDAEESWIQPFIDYVSNEMTMRYNEGYAIVFQTCQMYRKDRLAYVEQCIEQFKSTGRRVGLKLVRGAYMEKERNRAEDMGYPSPIHDTKHDTDQAFDSATVLCLENLHTVSVMVGSHNENSCHLAITKMWELNIDHDDHRVWFAQLYGMSDHISFNLANENYNVAKYLPFGPVKEVIPYLIRRAEENTSVKGQSNRELELIKSEMRRRKRR